MTPPRIGFCMFVRHAILLCAAPLVPRGRRKEWLAEWKSELWYVLQQRAAAASKAYCDRESLMFCLGAFRDAFWIRCNCEEPDSPQRHWLHSPVRCLALLASTAAATGALYFQWAEAGHLTPWLSAHFVFPHLLLIGIACLVLPATSAVGLGEYPATIGSMVREMRRRRWLFLGVKFALILLTVLWGAYALSRMTGITGLQPHVMLIGYIVAFRWALDDQRRRCPVCLRLLSNPATIGQPASTLLDWYGTELCCNKGHGLLHVPGIRSSYSTERWMELDGSWRNLFS